MLRSDFVSGSRDLPLAATAVMLAALAQLAIARPATAQWGDVRANCGTLIVAAANPGLALKVATARDGEEARLAPRDPGDPGQLWAVRLADDGGIFLESFSGFELVLEVSGGSGDDFAKIQMWGLNSPAHRRNQQWNLVPNNLTASGGAGNFVVISESSRKCLDVEWGNVVQGTKVWQYPCHGGPAQQWTFAGVVPYVSCLDPRLPR
jgi:Ricin-type beta-trefoil lectin domain-like